EMRSAITAPRPGDRGYRWRRPDRGGGRRRGRAGVVPAGRASSATAGHHQPRLDGQHLCPSLGAYLVSAVALLLLLSLGAIPCEGAAALSHQVELGNALWKIRIDAQRLAVSARPTGMAGMLVSAPQMDLGAVTRFEHGARQARGELPGKKETVLD